MPGGLAHQISKSVKYDHPHFTADAEKQRKMKKLVWEIIPDLSRALHISLPLKTVPNWEKSLGYRQGSGGPVECILTSPVCSPAVGMEKHTAGVSVSTDCVRPMAVLHSSRQRQGDAQVKDLPVLIFEMTAVEAWYIYRIPNGKWPFANVLWLQDTQGFSA